MKEFAYHIFSPYRVCLMGEWARGVSALILKLMERGVIVFSAGIVKFVVESVVTGSAIGQSLLGSGKGMVQSGPFTVGNRPCDGWSGDYKMLCGFGGPE